jgi:molecular chaperone HtpG
MYVDHRIMYREYIQNSCDSIRALIQPGLLNKNEARINIDIDKQKRFIEISDNGGGIPRNMFESKMKDIANSAKDASDNMGFRGIGHLIGLAYCAKVQFISKAYGETDECIATYDAKKMQAMLNEKTNYSVNEVIDSIFKLEFSKNSVNKEEHYFKVLLINISDERDDLLDIADIRDFLSFVSPVPYSSSFIFAPVIKKHAEELASPIEEYNIYINHQQIFKNYSVSIYNRSKVKIDEIKGIEFKEFYTHNRNLLGWMWFGISSFNGAIPESDLNTHRCIRIRKHNIQIGNHDTLRHLNLFKEQRGSSYFIGELFTVHSDLKPNARRDDFDPCQLYEIFKFEVKKYFSETLHKLYQTASKLRSAYKTYNDYLICESEYQSKSQTGFSGKIEKQQATEELNIKKEKAEKALDEIENIEKKSSDYCDLFVKVKNYVEETEEKKIDATITSNTNSINKSPISNKGFLPDQFTDFDKETRKVISVIYDVIQSTESEIAHRLIEAIQKKLSKITFK